MDNSQRPVWGHGWGGWGFYYQPNQVGSLLFIFTGEGRWPMRIAASIISMPSLSDWLCATLYTLSRRLLSSRYAIAFIFIYTYQKKTQLLFLTSAILLFGVFVEGNVISWNITTDGWPSTDVTTLYTCQSHRERWGERRNLSLRPDGCAGR